MKIGVFGINDETKELFDQKFHEHEISFFEESLSGENVFLAADCEILCIRSFSNLNKSVLEQLPNLKMITTRATGYDNVDVDYCKEKGITVCNVPGYGAHTVAEQTMALLLAISRNVIPSVERTRSGVFSSRGLQGIELYGKTLGIIGAGNIGKVVIEIAKGLGMQVVAQERNPDEKAASELGYQSVGLSTLLSTSDVISLHIPFTSETRHLLNREAFKKVKKGAILINTSRGSVVDTAALIDALQDGTLYAAGLDVLENENVLGEQEKKLLSLDNVFVTPHNGYNSKEAVERLLAITVKNIEGFINNNPQNVV